MKYRIFVLIFVVAAFFTVFSENYQAVKGEKSDELLYSQKEMETIKEASENGKIDLVEYYKSINVMKIYAVKQFVKMNNVNTESASVLSKQIDMLDNHIKMIHDIFLNKKDNYKDGVKFASKLETLTRDIESVDCFYLYNALELYNDFNNYFGFAFRDKNIQLISERFKKVQEKSETGYYNEIIDNMEFSEEDLITVASVGSKSVNVVYFDKETNTFKQKDVFPGTIIGNIKIMSIYNNRMVLFNLKTKKTIEKMFNAPLGQNNNEISFNDIKKQYRIVPWFGEDYEYSVKNGGEFNLYVKVIDEAGFILKPATLHLDGALFESDENGMITITMETSLFGTGKQEFTVSMNKDVNSDFTVNIDPRDMVINYSASAGVKAGVGLEPVLAGLSVGVKPSIDGTVSFIAPDINNKWKDKVMANLFPSLSADVSVSVGPKVKPLDIKAFSHNIGAGAGATIGASASTSIGVSQKYMFKDPYNSDRKAETIFLVDKLLKVGGPLGSLISHGVQKISDVNVSDYQVYGGLSISGNVGVNGNIGGSVGLVNTDAEGKITDTPFGVSGTLVSGSANISNGIEGGLISGETINGPTDERYNVALKCSLSGNFSAMEFGAKIFGKKIIPTWYLVNANGSAGLNLVFRFDKDFNMTKSMVIFSMGYKFKPNHYNQAIEALKIMLKENGAGASDYKELYDVKGMTKLYIFIIDKKKTEKYFSEWVAYSRNMLTRRNPEDEQTVVAKVKGLAGAISESINKLAETPVLMIEKTDLLLNYYTPELSIDVSLGVKVNLGIKTSFTKSKSYTDRVGYFSKFDFYPLEDHGYTKEIARADREITFLMNRIRYYVQDEVKNGANYVVKKAKDGTVYIAQKMADGAVYMFNVAKDGTVKATKYVGEKAKQAWNYTLDKVGNAAEYVAETASNVAEGIGNAISNAWNYWF